MNCSVEGCNNLAEKRYVQEFNEIQITSLLCDSHAKTISNADHYYSDLMALNNDPIPFVSNN